MLSASVAPLLSRQAFDLDGPSIPPPDGQVAMLDNPPNSNYFVVPLITVFTILSAVAFVIRFYAKYHVKKLNAADYLTFIVFPLFWVYIYYSYRLSYEGGYIVHQWDIRLGAVANFNYVTFIATLLYLWIVALVKCAILLEWIDIFVPHGERTYFTWTCWATCCAFASFSGIIFILDLVNCTPFRGNWDPLVPDVHCKFGIAQFGLASSTTNAVLDLIPLFLAQKIIWGLRLPRHKKIGVSLIFLVGIAGCAASLVRLYFSTRFYVSDDTSYYFSILAITSLAETTSANLVLCVPFAPKALNGVRQTRAFSLLTQYTSLYTTKTTMSGSRTTGLDSNLERYRELKPQTKKRREHWFNSSKITGTDTTYSVELREERSVDSERPFAESSAA
ncbi:hypothetical protein F5B18DRAFT_600991 [Nemania serpens]|nr:hypothetical protein F5B18DRAFT_600991 [Nemania serpens]